MARRKKKVSKEEADEKRGRIATSMVTALVAGPIAGAGVFFGSKSKKKKKLKTSKRVLR